MSTSIQVNMRIHVLGGFLGSGKTTLLMKIASSYIERGKKVSVIVNEAGDIGVDGTTLKGNGYTTTELPDGCICCTLTTSLLEAVTNIRNELNPDVMIIEPTGLALPSRVVGILDMLKDFDKSVNVIGMVDARRFPIFAEKKPEFITEQIKGSDIVLMNKIDVASDEEKKSTVEWISENTGINEIHPVSLKTGEGLDEVLKVIMDE